MKQAHLQAQYEPLFLEIQAITDGLAQARSATELRATIERCRQALVLLAAAGRMLHDGTAGAETPNDVGGWIDALDQSDAADASAELLRAMIDEAWRFVTREDVLGDTKRSDAESAVLAVDYAIGLGYVHLKRRLSPMLEHCPSCDSPHLATAYGAHRSQQAAFGVANCLDCGWSGA